MNCYSSRNHSLRGIAMTAHVAGIRFFSFVALLFYAATFAHAQTAGEMASMPEAKQRAIIDSLVTGSINNLSSKTDQDSRAMASLIRAWFTRDTERPSDVPSASRAGNISSSTFTSIASIPLIPNPARRWSFRFHPLAAASTQPTPLVPTNSLAIGSTSRTDPPRWFGILRNVSS
jgi:hypothetical protein